MDTVVFTDSSVISFFRDEFILTKINIDSSVELTRQYGVTGFPTFVVLDKAGREIDRTYGYHSAEELTERIRQINRGESLFRDLVTENRYSTDRVRMLELAEGYRVRGLIPEAEGWYRRAIETGASEDSLTVEARLYLGYMYFLIKDWDRMQPAYRDFLAAYPEHPYGGDIMMMLANSYFQQARWDSAMSVYQAVIRKYPELESLVDRANQRLDSIGVMRGKP